METTGTATAAGVAATPVSLRYLVEPPVSSKDTAGVFYVAGPLLDGATVQHWVFGRVQ